MNKKVQRMLTELHDRNRQRDIAKSNAIKVARAVHRLEQDKVLTDWHISALEQMLDAPEDLISDDWFHSVENDCRSFAKVFAPLINNNYDESLTLPVTVSGSSSAYAFIDDVSKTSYYKDKGLTWAEESKKAYECILEDQKRKQETSNLIKILNPDIDALFVNACENSSKVIAEITQSKEFVFELRTIMEKIKGELKDQLLKGKQVSGKQIFEKIGEELLGDKNDPVHVSYLKQSEKFKIMYNELSDIGKLRKEIKPNDMKSIFVKFVDNIYNILVILIPFISTE